MRRWALPGICEVHLVAPAHSTRTPYHPSTTLNTQGVTRLCGVCTYNYVIPILLSCWDRVDCISFKVPMRWKYNFCLFERLLKVKKTGVFLFGFIFFSFWDIYIFVLCKWGNWWRLRWFHKTGNIQSIISPEILVQKCSSQKKQNDTYYVVVMATLLAPVSFCQKPNIPICNLLKWDRRSSLEHTWFPYCLNSPH